jgi:hypothetical protein
MIPHAHPIPDALRRYRETHVIRVADRKSGIGDWFDHYCEHDGIRVHAIRGGWRHDQGEIGRLERAPGPLAGGPYRMMPGQTPYAPDEVALLHRMVADAAAGDPGEADEPMVPR